MLGGTFTARLNQELRVKRGWSYGVGSALSDALGPRPFYVYGAIQTDRTAEAAAVILDELSGIRGNKPPTEEELDRAARSLTLTLPGNNQTLTQVTGSIAHLLRLNLPDDYYQRYVPQVNTTTPEQTIEAARRLIEPQAMTWLFVGDRAKIEAPLRALFGDTLRFLNRDGEAVDG